MRAFDGTYLGRSNRFDIFTLIDLRLVVAAAREVKFEIMSMIKRFHLEGELEYRFGHNIALAGTDLVRISLTERLSTTAVALDTPLGNPFGFECGGFRTRR